MGINKILCSVLSETLMIQCLLTTSVVVKSQKIKKNLVFELRLCRVLLLWETQKTLYSVTLAEVSLSLKNQLCHFDTIRPRFQKIQSLKCPLAFQGRSKVTTVFIFSTHYKPYRMEPISLKYVW